MASILSDQQRAFLAANHSAVTATVDDRGRPHAVPVLCALVGGQRATMVAERRLGSVLTPERVYPSQR